MSVPTISVSGERSGEIVSVVRVEPKPIPRRTGDMTGEVLRRAFETRLTRAARARPEAGEPLRLPICRFPPTIRYVFRKTRWTSIDGAPAGAVKAGLPEERKALVERYMIDAEEAESRARRAADEQARREAAEEQARREAAEEQARREAEEQARRQAAAEARREAA
ncbi:MAG TPA: hypothetical protein VK613_02075, partial [Gaiellaceae bacterium]|nr:hypothetical protein [Gaiellaceae bacterium]